MRPLRGKWVLLGLSVVLIAIGAVLQARIAAVRVEVANRNLALQRFDQLRRENDKLRLRASEQPQASNPDAARLRAEVDALKGQLQAAKTNNAAAAPAPARESAIPVPTRLVVGVEVPSNEWRNAGRASPESALETALWAAVGGDVDAFASSLSFMDERTRTAAEALLQSLPADARRRYQTIERLIAALTITDVPTGSVRVREWGQLEERPMAFADAQLTGPDGASKMALVPFRRDAEGWKLLVSSRVIEKYAAQLKGRAPDARPAR